MTKYKRIKDQDSENQENQEENDISIRTLDNSIEDLIVTGLIVSTPFLKEIKKACNPNYFQSIQSKTLVSWVLDYSDKNNQESPGEQIKEIMDLHLSTLNLDEAKTMQIFLDKIIKVYGGREFNHQYVANKAFPYLKQKAYIYKTFQVQLLLRKGETDEAAELFHRIPNEVFKETSRWKSFSDIDSIGDWWWKRKESAMTFPGALGDYMPMIYPGKLYAMLGPAKSGKSFWLGEWCINGIQSGLNTVLFSLEMNTDECHERWIQRISGKEIMQAEEKTYKIPVIDCLHNQDGTCESRHCASPGTIVAQLVGKDHVREEYEEHKDHEPCTHCRDQNNDMFQPTTWFVEETIEKLSFNQAQKTQVMFDNHYMKDKFRYLTFPIGTASVEDVVEALDDLEKKENFLVDLVVIDYADIMKKDSSNRDLRFKLRDIWEELSRLAKVRNCIVVTASQGNRGSLSKDRLAVEDIAEDISKIMTIDAIFAINEEGKSSKNLVEMDKYWQVQRIETLMLRYGDFPYSKQCITLHDRSRGQVHLDSYIK